MLLPSVFTNDDFFDNFFNDTPLRRTYMPEASMKCDIKELKDSYQIDMQLPGYDKNDVKVELKDGYLTVSAAHNENKEDKEEGKYIRRECYSGSCERSFYVGDHVNKDNVKASFKNGILTLVTPKEEALPKEDTRQLVEIEG